METSVPLGQGESQGWRSEKLGEACRVAHWSLAGE